MSCKLLKDEQIPAPTVERFTAVQSNHDEEIDIHVQQIISELSELAPAEGSWVQMTQLRRVIANRAGLRRWALLLLTRSLNDEEAAEFYNSEFARLLHPNSSFSPDSLHVRSEPEHPKAGTVPSWIVTTIVLVILGFAMIGVVNVLSLF